MHERARALLQAPQDLFEFYKLDSRSTGIHSVDLSQLVCKSYGLKLLLTSEVLETAAFDLLWMSSAHTRVRRSTTLYRYVARCTTFMCTRRYKIHVDSRSLDLM